MLDSVAMLNGSSLQTRWRRSGRRQQSIVLVLFVVVIAIAWFALQTRSAMPDFSEYVAGPERKTAFFAFVEPLIVAENTRVLQDRERLLAIAADGDPGFFDRRWLASLAEDYGIDEPDAHDPELVNALLLRVDSVPLSLALAQSAKESGWGTSRFASEGYNLFGQWCFKKGCGIVPLSRPAGRSHEVERFSSPRHSVASYLNNINSHREYEAFRLERAQLRQANKPLSGSVLAGNLTQYSERRDAYVQEIRSLIRINNLESRQSHAAN